MIGDKIRECRISAGLTQEQLSERLHIVRQTLSKWEKGSSSPDGEMLLKISQELNVPVTELLGVENESEAEVSRLEALLKEQTEREQTARRIAEKRGVIVFLSFAAMLVMLIMENEVLSFTLSGGIFLLMTLFLYRCLPLLSGFDAGDKRLMPVRVTTIFSVLLILVCLAAAVMTAVGVLSLSDESEKIFAVSVISAVMIFAGIISPRLPFTRHTGLRLPWTVSDEETWYFAHRLMGYISLPLALVYIALAFTVRHFEAVTAVTVAVWILVPSIASAVFCHRKFKGK